MAACSLPWVLLYEFTPPEHRPFVGSSTRNSMVDLVTIQRAYAANVDAMRAMDSVLGAVTTEVGKAG